MTSIQNHIDPIANAQADGVVPDQFNARFLYALLLHIAALWAMPSPDVLAVVDINDPEVRRQLVQAAVRSYTD